MATNQTSQRRTGESQTNSREEDNESIHFILTDPEALDCPVCFTTFTSPVFQCVNGHAICSSCSSKVEEKCPTCCSSISKQRCRAIEKVLESVKAICRNAKYGCKEAMSYFKKHDHEMRCHHAPCSCPISHCNFVGSSSNLNQHFSANHKDSAFRFVYSDSDSDSFDITIDVNEKFIVLQEEKRGDLFVLISKRIENFANGISICCIAPSWRKGNSCYISSWSKGRLISFHFDTISIQNWVGDYNQAPSMEFLLVPSDFFDSNGKLQLSIRIYGSSLIVNL